ncbi:MAG: glycosyltransferase family 39 protein [Lachnotalea sp.]
MKLEGIKKTAYLFSITLLTLFMLYIVFCTFKNLDYADYVVTFMKDFSVPIYLFTGALVIFVFVYIVGFQLIKLRQKEMKRVAIIIGLSMIAIQITVIYFIRSPLRSDSGNVFDQALAMVATNRVSPTAVENYFSIYPNNIPVCILEYLILKLGSVIGIEYEHYLLYLDLFNALCIDLAMYFAYQIIKMIKREVTAVKFLVLCAINPLLYAYTILVYTSTLSMPFIIGSIYFFLRAYQEKNYKKKIVYSILTTITLFLGFQLRATVIITVIAIGIYLILQMKQKITKEIFIYKCKIAIFIILSLLVVRGIYNTVEHNYVKFDTSETGFPITHWLMMGAQGSGGFNVEDFNYTLSFATREERIDANLVEYKRRISDLGVKGTFHLMLNKLRVTWSDGLDATIDSLSDNETYYQFNDYLTGSKKDIYVSYCHMYNLMLMILILTSTMQGFKRKYDNPIVIIYLNLLGGMIFHLFWEAGAAYNICFTFLMLILAEDGLEFISQRCRNVNVRKVQVGVCGLTILSTIVLLISGYQDMVKTPFKQYPIAVNQDFHENETPALNSGEELVQTFVTSRAFNRIEIKVRNLAGEENDSRYKLELLDENDNVLISNVVIGCLAIDTDYYRIPIDTIVPDRATEYKIKITTKKADDDNNLVFMLYNTGNWNIYEGGTLYVNGEESRGSLTFQICESVTETFFTQTGYMMFAGVILLVELLLIVLMSIYRIEEKVDNSSR